MRSRLDESRLGELANICESRHIGIMAIQEHRLAPPDGYIDGDAARRDLEHGWVLLFVPADLRGQGGVGILMARETFAAVSAVTVHSARVLSVEMSSALAPNSSGSLSTVFMSVYSPTSSSGDGTGFYSDLAEAVMAIPTRHMLVLAGDFNATLGRSDLCHTSIAAENANRELLLDLLDVCDLAAVNTMFQKPDHRLVTFQGPYRRHVTLDYVLCKRKWGACVLDATTYATPTFKSDHRLVVASVRWRLSATTTPRARLRDVSMLRDPESETTVNFVAKMGKVLADDDGGPPQEVLGRALQQALPMLPFRRGMRKVPLMDLPSVSAARTRALAHPHEPHLTRGIASAYEEGAAEQLLELVKNVDAAHHPSGKMKMVWESINLIAGRGNSVVSPIVRAGSPRERLELIRVHVAKLFAPKEDEGGTGMQVEPPVEPYEYMVPDSVVIGDAPFTPDELSCALSRLKNGKAVDGTGMSAEILKLPLLRPLLLSLINGAFMRGQMPAEWLIGEMVLVHKKGDVSDLNNFRGIVILHAVVKLYMAMIHMRLACKLDKHLRPNQNGFRAGRSTIEHILAVRRLIEESQRSQSAQLHVLFLDFAKAFDSVKWSQLWAILRAYRVPERIISAVRSLYIGSSARVRTKDGLSDPFQFHAGVKQGCVLSPLLFILVIDFVMRRAVDTTLGVQLIAPGYGPRHPGLFVTDTGFADDIALMSDGLGKLQVLTDRVVAEAALVGLAVNVQKTKLMCIVPPSGRDQGCATEAVVGDIFVYGKAIALCDDFKFLGSYVRSTEKDFSVRRALAWRACQQLQPLWSSPLRWDTKRRLFQCFVLPVLTYGSEAWTLSPKLSALLDGTHTRLLRKCLDVHYSRHLSNAALYGSLPAPSFVVAERRLRLAGHCARAAQPVAHVLLWTAPGERKVGRPPLSYVDLVCKDAKVTRDELGPLMRSRAQWKRVVSNLG